MIAVTKTYLYCFTTTLRWLLHIDALHQASACVLVKLAREHFNSLVLFTLKFGFQVESFVPRKCALYQLSYLLFNSLPPGRWGSNFKSVIFKLIHRPHSCQVTVPGGRFKNTYELLNQRALKFSYVNKIHIFQCMGKIFCVEFQRYPLKFHTKYLTHTLKDMIFMQFWNFKSS